MSKPKFTPGPWRYGYDEEETKHVVRMATAIDDPWHHRTHHLWECEHCIEPDDKGFDEADANARLIAAAPEMYALLRRISITDMTDRREGDPIHDDIDALLARIDGGEEA